MTIVRLGPGANDHAQALFRLMAEVFEEPRSALGTSYVERLLARRDFWALAALENDHVIGGLTAHVLPMTTSETSELFIYDVAVHAAHQRQGIGRQLFAALREQAASEGIDVLFVAADNEDVHALDFYRAIGGAPSPVTLFSFSASQPGSKAS